MILIIGALGAGKKEYLHSLGYSEKDMSRCIETACPIVVDLHEYLRENQRLTENNFLTLLQKEYILCNEVGCGIVPLEEKDRAWRETVGQSCSRLAKEATAVIRIVCGLPEAIKGELPCR